MKKGGKRDKRKKTAETCGIWRRNVRKVRRAFSQKRTQLIGGFGKGEGVA